MVPFVISLIALVPAIKAMCYSPMIHGFAPDVILPSVFSSEVYCPPPHVFDHFVCMCVDPSVVTLPVPREARTNYEVSVLGAKRHAGNPSYRIAQLAGLPDMHVPGRTAVSWGPVNGYRFAGGSSGTARRVVPALNPYGSFNMPANSNAAVKAAAKAKLMEAATLPIKQQEILEKIRWQEQLQRESAAAAAAAAELAVAAAAAAVPGPSSVGGGSALDGFMRDTLRRILYGY